MSDEMRRRSPLRALLVTSAAVLLIVLVAITAAANLPAITFNDPGFDPGPRPQASGQTGRPAGEEFDLSDAKDPEKDVPGNLGEVWDVARWVLLAAAGALLAAIVARRLLNRPEAAPTVAAEDTPALALRPEDADEAFASAEVELLDTSDVSEAIINVWLTLERLVATSGIERLPHQTTGEYVVAVLATLHPDEAPLQALADLYRRALFDDSRPTEVDRQAALDLLAGLRDQVGVRRG